MRRTLSILAATTLVTASACSRSDRGDAGARGASPAPASKPEPSAQNPPKAGFQYRPTFGKAVATERPAVVVLEAQRRAQGDLWVLAAEVRDDAGGLGIDAYHFAPRPEDGVLEPDGDPVRLLSVDGDRHDDVLRADLRRSTAVPQTRTVDPHEGHREALGDLSQPEALIPALGERARTVADRAATAEARARALAELLAMTKGGPFRRPEHVAEIVETFAVAPRLDRVEPGTESRLGMTVRLEDGTLVTLERRPGKQPTDLMVDGVEPPS